MLWIQAALAALGIGRDMYESNKGLQLARVESEARILLARAQHAEAMAQAEATWDITAMQASATSWKDEYILILLSIPLILAFVGMGGVVENGFAALEGVPEWYKVSFGAAVAASFGIKGILSYFGRKSG